MVFNSYTFLLANFAALMAAAGIDWRPVDSGILLPIGISFYTFASLSNTLDVYRGEVRHDWNFADYAHFVSFFPHLVAGPILRARRRRRGHAALLRAVRRSYTLLDTRASTCRLSTSAASRERSARAPTRTHRAPRRRWRSASPPCARLRRGLPRGRARARPHGGGHPCEKFWERFLHEGVVTGFACPDGSHLDMRDRAVFSQPLAAVLRRHGYAVCVLKQ